MELPSSNIKKILIFTEIKSCTFRPQPSKLIPKKVSYIFSKESFFLYFRKRCAGLSSPSSKNKKIHPEKISYASGNGSPYKTSYMKAVLTFQETKKTSYILERVCRAPKIKKTNY